MVPVHELEWPPDLSHADIEDLAGNTMHLKAVGLAMLIALSMVKWGPQSARLPAGPGEKPSIKAKPPREVVADADLSWVN